MIPPDDDAPAADAPGSPEPVRRDFLTLLTLATATVGACAFALPFLDSLDGTSQADPADALVDVDPAQLAPGQQITVVWRGRPVFVTRRSADDLRLLQDAALQAGLQDPASAEPQQPAYATNWHRSIVPEYGVLVGICTHLGCVPRYRPTAEAAPGGAHAGGYACPCHGSRFDLAGRVFTGAPAPYNLPVPPYSLSPDGHLRIGANPDGASFDFESIRQI